MRDRACWLVSEAGNEIVVARVASDTGRVFAEQRAWPTPRPGWTPRGFVSPLPDGGLAVVGNGVDQGVVTVYDAGGLVRWTYEFAPWSDRNAAGPSCVADATGRRLLVTTTGPVGADGLYLGDVCVVLDLADGRRVTDTMLPSRTAGYVFQQSLTDPAQVFLDALMGDTFHSLAVTLEDDILRTETVGEDDEPFGGVSLNGVVLKLDVGGGWLVRCKAGQEDITAEVKEILPEGLRFVGYRPGLLDKDRVLAAVAEEQDSADNRHLILDSHTLQPVAELAYPGTASCDPLALGDGTWLTADGGVVRRWRVAECRMATHSLR